MKKCLLSVIVVLQLLTWSSQAAAAPCSTSTLGAYVGLGTGGCTIGALSFSNFALRAPAAGAVTSAAITVIPVLAGPTIVGLRFGVSPTASGGSYFDDLITYRVGAVAANIVGSTVDFAGTSVTGDAAVSVLEQLCLGGTFNGADGVSNCSSGRTADLAVVDVGFGPDPAYSLAFAAVAFLTVATDLAFDSGSGFVPGSSSTLTSGTNLFTFVGARVVPEPTDALLLGIGLLALAGSARRDARRRASAGRGSCRS